MGKENNPRRVAENEAFAKAHGINGTPVIVRSDGAVIEGFKPKAQLVEWLKGAKS